jgi:hypothetical protein
MYRKRGESLVVLRRHKGRSNRVSPPLPLDMIKSLGLLTCSKTEFDRIAKTLCTISKRDQKDDDE